MRRLFATLEASVVNSLELFRVQTQIEQFCGISAGALPTYKNIFPIISCELLSLRPFLNLPFHILNKCKFKHIAFTGTRVTRHKSLLSTVDFRIVAAILATRVVLVLLVSVSPLAPLSVAFEIFKISAQDPLLLDLWP